MREIKFRGFRTVQKDWVYGNLIVDENGTKYIVDNKLFSADGHLRVKSKKKKIVAKMLS